MCPCFLLIYDEAYFLEKKPICSWPFDYGLLQQLHRNKDGPAKGILLFGMPVANNVFGEMVNRRYTCLAHLQAFFLTSFTQLVFSCLI